MMSIECARQLLEALDEDMLDASLPPVSDLFEAASVLAQGGDLAAKGRIHEAISKRADASRGDKLRVEIYRFDLVRRKGDPAAALRGLTELEQQLTGVDVWVFYDYFRARAECHARVGEVEKAIGCYRSGLRYAKAGPPLPPDKYLDLLGGFAACKIKARELDRELERCFAEWYCALLYDYHLGGVSKERAWGQFFLQQGELFTVRYQYDCACASFADAFLRCPTVREKVLCAMEYLYSAWRQEPLLTDDLTVAMSVFFATNQKCLTPTDIQWCQEQYDFVTQRLAATP